MGNVSLIFIQNNQKGHGMKQIEKYVVGEFVNPYYIEELGCLGLTAADIAKSLRIEAKAVRQKLRDREFLERIKTQGFQAVTFAASNDSNGLDVEEYALETNAARFFVGKYNNLTADAYLAYLIRLENNVQALQQESEADPLLKSILDNVQLRRKQISQERELKEHSQKLLEHDSKLAMHHKELQEALAKQQLNTEQKKILKQKIDQRALFFGNISYAGNIQSRLKKYFRLNATSDKWYMLAQKDFHLACTLVDNCTKPGL